MGALHAGHLELIRRARAGADYVVVSIFVNPAQFGPSEDFTTYPRDLAQDAKLIAELGLNNIILFTPDVTEIYPAQSLTQFELGDIAARWTGAARPGHFVGVALVVTKLFNIVQPDIALFGEKDFQQLQVIRQIVRDLSMPVEIVGVEIVREASGLAMSSRNAYLTDEQRNRIAPQFFLILQQTAEAIRNGQTIDDALEKAKASLTAAGFGKVDYFAYVDSETLQSLSVISTKPSRLLAVAWLGKTLLIDNISVT
jgi:pantoate--beta-alanine ligase